MSGTLFPLLCGLVGSVVLVPWGAVVAKGAGLWLDRWADRPPRTAGTALAQGMLWWVLTVAAGVVVLPGLVRLTGLVERAPVAVPAWAVEVGWAAALHLTTTATAAVALPSGDRTDPTPPDRSWRAVGVCAAAAAAWLGGPVALLVGWALVY